MVLHPESFYLFCHFKGIILAKKSLLQKALITILSFPSCNIMLQELDN